MWSTETDEAGAIDRLTHLKRALSVCLPVFQDAVDAALEIVERDVHRPRERTTPHPATASARDERSSIARRSDWDPIAPPSRKPPVARSVSVEPWELPPTWQEKLRRAASGLPGNGGCISQAIVRRMREKLCQLAWSARQAGLSVELSPQAAERYLFDLKLRCEARPHGLRWATLRASFEELHRFARYSGCPSEIVRHLARLYWDLEGRERGQLALKHFALAETGNTTDLILDKAEALLKGVTATEDHRKRHRMRNGACILGLYAIAPLRNASANLVLGRTLFWRDERWVIDTQIQKTAMRNPERFVMPLEPETGKYVDAVLLGERSILLLPKLRMDAMKSQRQLFLLANGSPAAESYIPRIFKILAKNSFTTTRTMIHTDEAIRNGAAGVERAMNACHQVRPEIRHRYQLAGVTMHAIATRQGVSRARRAAHAADLDLGFLEDLSK